MPRDTSELSSPLFTAIVTVSAVGYTLMIAGAIWIVCRMIAH
jgi:uncharacterized membrane protein